MNRFLDIPCARPCGGARALGAAIIAGLLVAGCGPLALDREPEPLTPAERAELAQDRITEDAARAHLDYLASDEMRGRDTPSPELEEAAQYIADEFEAAGLAPAGDGESYMQEWTFQHSVLVEDASEAWAELDGQREEWRYRHDYFAFVGMDTPVEGTPVFAPDPASTTQLPEETQGSPLVVDLPAGLDPQFSMAVQNALQAGASGVILLMDDEFDAPGVDQMGAALEAGAAPPMPIPMMALSYEAGREFMERANVDGGGPEVLEDVTLGFRSEFEDRADEVPNVVAKIPGSDPEVTDESVVVTAHFDHVGVGPPDETGDSIYSGADDNASGTAALMEVASTFAELPEGPDRTVIFLAVSGEEKGLLGSAYWAENPSVEQDEVVAALNMDMVSRNDPEEVHAIGKEYSTIGEVTVEMAEAHPELGLSVEPDPEPEEQAFLRSDHFSFVEQGIPGLMLTTWLHDDYHLPSDTPDRADADQLARVAQLAFLVTHRLAEAEVTPEWTEEGEAFLEELQAQQQPPG